MILSSKSDSSCGVSARDVSHSRDASSFSDSFGSSTSGGFDFSSSGFATIGSSLFVVFV